MYTPLPSGTCRSSIRTSSASNEFLESFSWGLKNIENEVIILSSSANEEASTEHAESKCLPCRGNKILFKNSTNVVCNQKNSCLAQAEEKSFSDKSTGESFVLKSFFTVCSSDEDFDYCDCNSKTNYIVKASTR